MTNVRFYYLSTEYGQLHARRAGEGKPVVLLHLTPGSGAQFDHVLPVLAARGYEAWALDALGNGRSAPLPDRYSFEMAASALAQAIDDAGLSAIRLVGGHMTAQMAVELVIQRPGLATHLVLDGLPMWDRATREQIIGHFDNSAPEAAEDGGHILEAWRRALNLHRAWNPGLAIDVSGNRRVTQALIDTLQQGLDMQKGAAAFLSYDVQPQLANLTLPTLVTTATADTLADQHTATVEAINDVLTHEFSGTHPRHVDSRAEEYVDVLVSFFETASV